MKFKKAEVEGLLLKVEFIGAAKSRVFLAKPEVAEKIISAPLTATRTAEHRIIFSSLERKVANFEIDKSSVKDAFDELKEADIASSLGVLGDQAYLEKLLGDSDYSKDVSLTIVEYLASKDQASQLELIHKLAAYVNVDKIDTELKVKCSGLNSYAIIPGEKVNYQLKFTPGKEISGIMKEEVSFVNDYRTANEKLLNYSKTLMGISEKLEIVTAKISLANEKGDVLYSSCILSNQEVVEDGSAEGPEYADLSVFEKFDPSSYKSYEEAQLALSSQRDKTKEMINGLLIKDGYKDPDLSNKLVDEMVYVDAAVKTAMANAYTFFSGGQQRRM